VTGEKRGSSSRHLWSGEIPDQSLRRRVMKVAVIKRRSGAFPQVKILKVDLCNLSAMGVAPDPDIPLTGENAVVCG
jgi:hypothetical protein